MREQASFVVLPKGAAPHGCEPIADLGDHVLIPYAVPRQMPTVLASMRGGAPLDAPIEHLVLHAMRWASEEMCPRGWMRRQRARHGTRGRRNARRIPLRERWSLTCYAPKGFPHATLKPTLDRLLRKMAPVERVFRTPKRTK